MHFCCMDRSSTCTARSTSTTFTSTRGPLQFSVPKPRALLNQRAENAFPLDRGLSSTACGVRLLDTAVMELIGKELQRRFRYLDIIDSYKAKQDLLPSPSIIDPLTSSTPIKSILYRFSIIDSIRVK